MTARIAAVLELNIKYYLRSCGAFILKVYLFTYIYIYILTGPRSPACAKLTLAVNVEPIFDELGVRPCCTTTTRTEKQNVLLHHFQPLS